MDDVNSKPAENEPAAQLPPMRVDILTIFPRFFDSMLDFGILSRAIRQNRVQVNTTDLRDFTNDRHRTVDDRPFGGGEGMVLKPEPIFAAASLLGVASKAERKLATTSVVLLSARGVPFTQGIAHQLALLQHLVFICGRYEGVDERVNQHLCDRELSIGDYVVSGGELAAAVIVDAIVRLLPGAVGNADSTHYESFGAAGQSPSPAAEGRPSAVAAAGGLLDYPHYTRPAEFSGFAVPEALLCGDHESIRRWRREQALAKTLHNRPDLLTSAVLSKEDQMILHQLREST